MIRFISLIGMVSFLTMSTLNTAAAEISSVPFYIGTYTKPDGSQGVYRATLDLKSGQSSTPELALEITSPSFLALHPTLPVLYAAQEMGEFNGQKTGAVAAIAMDTATGGLKLLNQQSSGGGGPCFVSVDPAGKFAFVANYGGGSVAALPLSADGSLGAPVSIDKHKGSGPNPKRQQRAFAHSIVAAPSGPYALAADLGNDRIYVYKIDAANPLSPANPPTIAAEPGAGPRHIARHPNGKFVYVVNELSNTVTPYTWANDTLKPMASITTLPADFSGNNTTSEIAVHPNGKYVYAANRGHESIASFKVNEDGTLTALAHTSVEGKQPRHFAIDPTGQFLLVANQQSNQVVLFRLHPDTGALTATGQSLSVGAPSCIRFVAK